MGRKKRKRVASRGSVNNIILRTLVNGDKYGYEIIKEVEEYSNGKIVLKQPSLYSSLTRFEEKKFVSSYWGDSDIGGRRHYYHLTDEGLEYYKRVVLKETDDEVDEDISTVLEENNIELSSDSTHYSVSDLDDEDVDFETESTENDIDDSMVINEISENEIPEIVNFESYEEFENEKPFIAEHAFHTTTPMEEMINNNIEQEPEILNEIDNEQIDIEQIDESIEEQNPTTYNNIEEEDEEADYEQIVNNLRHGAKKQYRKYIDNNVKKLYFKKPKKVKKIILDSDGIYKLRDEDYVPIKRKPDVIIDNVIKRQNHSSDVLGYASYTNSRPQEKKATPSNQIAETEEEKRQRNENFVAKFNLLTMSKMKPVSTPVPKPQPVEEKKPTPSVDYRGKLNAILESNNVFIEDDVIEEEPTNSIPTNNMFTYVDEDKWNTAPQQTTQTATTELISSVDDEDNEVEDAFISLDEEETFETKTNNSEYIEEINTYTAPPTPVKMTRYDNVTQAVLVDKTYLLNNKLKLFFGLIMSFIMIAEVTSLLLLFRNLNLVQDNDKTLFIISYSLIGVFALVYIIPYFVNSNSHKANNFKLKYSIWFGILTFLVCSILIYCFNALSGFEIDNLNYFAVKLFVPMTLMFNFIIGPLVYSLLLKNKNFYD